MNQLFYKNLYTLKITMSKKEVKKKPTKKVSSKATTKKESTKKVEKAPEKKAVEKKASTTKKDNSPYIIGGAIIVLALIVAVIFLVYNSTNNNVEEFNVEMNQDGENVVALVNGEPVKQKQINFLRNQIILSGASEQDVDMDRVLTTIINQELLVQEANRQGFTVTEEEAQAQIEMLASMQGINREQFESQLRQLGLTDDLLIEELQRQMAINQFQRVIAEQFDVSDEEARTFFEENREELTQGFDITYEDAEVEIKNFLLEERVNEYLDALLQELRSNAQIEYI